MNGFRTARALVVDDDRNEAIVALQALGSLSVASVYHDGEPPAEGWSRYQGMRLLLLDMVLGNRGATGDDPKADMGVLMAALEELLDPGSDSLVAVCWTRNPKTSELLKAAFGAVFPKARLAEVILAEKGDLADPGLLKDLSAKISKGLSDDGASSLLYSWEQTVHDASSRTTSSLFELANEFGGDPLAGQTRAFEIGAALAIADRGSRLKNESGAIAMKAFTNSLVPLLADRIEHSPVSEANGPLVAQLKSAVVAETAALAENDSKLSDSLRAKLNSKLNISFDVQVGEVCPGSVYARSQEAPVSNIMNGLVSGATWNEAGNDTFFDQDNPTKAVTTCQGGHAVLVEITPPCDFAQANCKLQRFCLGILVPVSVSHQIRERAAYLRKLGPLHLSGDSIPDGSYYLVLNCHYILGLTKGNAAKLLPLFRIRMNALADLVAWQSSQASRPGYIEVRP